MQPTMTSPGRWLKEMPGAGVAPCPICKVQRREKARMMFYVRRRSAPFPFKVSTRSLRENFKSRKMMKLNIMRSSGMLKTGPFTDYHGRVWPAWNRLKSIGIR